MSEDVTNTYSVEAWLTRIRNAVGVTPMDWDAIRGATMSLEGEARTKEQKAAVETLKRASHDQGVLRAASARRARISRRKVRRGRMAAPILIKFSAARRNDSPNDGSETADGNRSGRETM
jgi:hypothetical protein